MNPTERLTAALADRYEIERELGQGGMATVYLARDVKHDRKVALKVLRPELAAVIGGERFLQEIKTTANLNHPHILPLHDSGEADGIVYYVMPYVEGESLRARMDREKQLPVDEAIRIAREVADALDYAHRQGVIHRDIKPDNILLHDGRVLVADFGIALAASRTEGGSRMTETGMSLGTPHYMSPEQAMGEREIRAASDVYALACVLYEMLMGEPPFSGPTVQAIVAKVLTDQPAPMMVHRRSIPPHVENAVMVALEKLPADRFSTAAEFAAAVGGATTTRTAAHAVPSAAGGGASARWRAAAVAAAVVAVGALGWALAGDRDTEARQVLRVSVGFPEGQQLRAASTRRFDLAPDGSRIVYVGPDTAGTQLWVRELSSLQARPLPGTSGAQAPFFSPDGQSVAFFTGNPGDLLVVPVAGGPTLTVVADSTSPWGGDWAPDGTIYFTDAQARLARVAATGGLVEPVAVPNGDSGITELDWAQALPGGRFVLVQLWHSSIGDAELGLVDVETGDVRALVTAMWGRYIPTGHLVYATFDGNLLTVPFDLGRGELAGAATPVAGGVRVDPVSGSAQFAVSDNGLLTYLPGGGVGSQQVTWVDRAGRMTPVDTLWRGNFGTLTLSPDQTRLAISVLGASGEQIWVKRLPVGQISRLSYGGLSSSRPVWSPDGRRVSFISSRGARRQAYSQRADGSAEADSLQFHENQVDEVVWLPSGDSYLFRSGSSGMRTRDIWRGWTDGRPVEPMVTGPADEFAPAVSPDGRWFAHVSNESGRNEVFIRRVDDPAAGRIQVSTEGGDEPRWAHSGRELFYRTGRDEMMVAEVTPSPELRVGVPQVLFRTPNLARDNYHSAYDVRRDDRQFLMVHYLVGDLNEIVLVVNWFEELRDR